LLFAHWPVSAGTLRPLLPPRLTVQEFAGSAWVAITPFWMSGVRFHNWLPLPFASRFEELNVRTYVSDGEYPGVWFFSLDAASGVAVQGARRLYRLPYVRARMSHGTSGTEISYHSVRRDGTRFAARYRPAGPITLSRPGTLEHWLTERYCLYAQGKGNRLFRAEIHHEPWPLQPATAEIVCNDLFRIHGIAAAGPPASLLYAQRLPVLVWPPVPVKT
jgi:uncharacterized protein YqjF (DUF2071 family)